MDQQNDTGSHNRMMDAIDEARRESRLRRRAERQNLKLEKSRARVFTSDDQGGYRLINTDLYILGGTIEAGERYDLDLDDGEAYLADDDEAPGMSFWEGLRKGLRFGFILFLTVIVWAVVIVMAAHS